MFAHPHSRINFRKLGDVCKYVALKTNVRLCRHDAVFLCNSPMRFKFKNRLIRKCWFNSLSIFQSCFDVEWIANIDLLFNDQFELKIILQVDEAMKIMREFSGRFPFDNRRINWKWKTTFLTQKMFPLLGSCCPFKQIRFQKINHE